MFRDFHLAIVIAMEIVTVTVVRQTVTAIVSVIATAANSCFTFKHKTS